jgi:hypothetical protein
MGSLVLTVFRPREGESVADMTVEVRSARALDSLNTKILREEIESDYTWIYCRGFAWQDKARLRSQIGDGGRSQKGSSPIHHSPSPALWLSLLSRRRLCL